MIPDADLIARLRGAVDKTEQAMARYLFAEAADALEAAQDKVPYIDAAIRESAKASTMTFEELVEGCSPDEREQLAWHLAMLRARKTVQALAKKS